MRKSRSRVTKSSRGGARVAEESRIIRHTRRKRGGGVPDVVLQNGAKIKRPVKDEMGLAMDEARILPGIVISQCLRLFTRLN